MVATRTRLAAVVVVLMVASGGADAGKKKCRRLIEEGKSAAAEGLYDDARKLYHQAYSSCGDPVALVHIAKAFQDEGKPGYALEYAKRFLNEVDDTHPLHAAITQAAHDLQAKVEAGAGGNKGAQLEGAGSGNIQGARRSVLDERAGGIDFRDELPPGKTGLYVELGGTGVYATANVERYLTTSLVIRLGAGYWTAGSATDMDASVGVFTVPLSASYLVGTASHSLEIGLGGTAVYFADPSDSTTTGDVEADGLVPAATAVLGYRYAGSPRGFLVRVGYTPLLFFGGGEKSFAHSGGLSLGARL